MHSLVDVKGYSKALILILILKIPVLRRVAMLFFMSRRSCRRYWSQLRSAKSEVWGFLCRLGFAVI